MLKGGVPFSIGRGNRLIARGETSGRNDVDTGGCSGARSNDGTGSSVWFAVAARLTNIAQGTVVGATVVAQISPGLPHCASCPSHCLPFPL